MVQELWKIACLFWPLCLRVAASLALGFFEEQLPHESRIPSNAQNSFCTVQRAKSSRGLCGNNKGRVGHTEDTCVRASSRKHTGEAMLLKCPHWFHHFCSIPEQLLQRSTDEERSSDKRLSAAHQKPACAKKLLLTAVPWTATDHMGSYWTPLGLAVHFMLCLELVRQTCCLHFWEWKWSYWR